MGSGIVNTKNTSRKSWVALLIIITLSIASVSIAIADSNEDMDVRITIGGPVEEGGVGPAGGAPTAAPVVKEEVEEGEALPLGQEVPPLLEGPLFDIELTIPEDYLEILPGRKLLFSVKLTNLGFPGRADVTLEYWVEDSQNKTVYQGSETAAVETSASFTNEINLHSNLEPGDYVLYAKVIYGDNQVATAYAPFKISEEKPIPVETWYAILLLLIFIALVIVILKYEKKIKEKMAERRIKKEVHDVIEKKGKD